MMHAVWLLVFMMLAAPLASWVPLASLAAVLLVVAWNMSEARHLPGYLHSATRADRLVLAATLVLTIFVDLIAAIGVGVALALILTRRTAPKPAG